MTTMGTGGFVHQAGEVFSFAGYLSDSSREDLVTGYAVAEGPQGLLAGAAKTGLTVVALTSLAELDETIGVLEAIASRHPQVDPAEVVDVYPAEVTSYPADSVFCFTGHIVDARGQLKSGFIVASDVNFLVDYLHGLGFVVESAASLSDLKRTRDQLTKIALGTYDAGDFDLLDLKSFHD